MTAASMTRRRAQTQTVSRNRGEAGHHVAEMALSRLAHACSPQRAAVAWLWVCPRFPAQHGWRMSRRSAGCARGQGRRAVAARPRAWRGC
jgi:hypothetical protein